MRYFVILLFCYYVYVIFSEDQIMEGGRCLGIRFVNVQDSCHIQFLAGPVQQFKL